MYKTDIAPCLSILNSAYHNELLEWSDKHNLQVWENYLSQPDWLHVKNAPDSLKEQFKINTNWFSEPADTNQQRIFVEEITKLDNFRRVNIKDYLPEVAQAYGIS
jgi:hypothetical protein